MHSSSYPDINDNKFIEKVYNKLEYVIYEKKSSNNKHKEIYNESLQLASHQMFVKNFLSIHTPYKKMLLYHAVGTGKTLSAWGISKTFIEEYKKYDRNEETPKIFILGFTEHLFKSEFTKWTELGFINKKDIENLLKIKKEKGTNSQEYVIERANIFFRLSNPKYGGYYKFYGYQELYNKLFIKIDQTLNFDLVEDNIDIYSMLKYIEQGKFEVNLELLNSFENSLLICDEIHNTYNSEEINNYGICIMYITLMVKSMKTVYMTATPLNNNPREIIDIINLLSDNLSDFLPYKTYEDILSRPNPLPALEELISTRLKGKVSVFENIDLRLYPTRNLKGEHIKNIGLLKFERCYMSEYFYDNYIKVINYDRNENATTLKILDKIYEDIILPDRLNNDNLILQQTTEWMDEHSLYFSKQDNISFGRFYDAQNLKKYSPKYHKMIKTLDNTPGKVFIYHTNINKSGVNMIASILNENGYIDQYDIPHDDTRCSICNKLKSEKHINHEFTPLRYILYTGNEIKNTLRDMVQLFNDVKNVNGTFYKVLVGSKVISEGVTLKEVNDCFIMTLPINISRMIQVVGRCTRNSTHLNMEESRRYVDIHIFIHSMTNAQKTHFKQHFNANCSIDEIYTVEEYKYKNKTADHIEIQYLEKILKENAVDGLLYPYNSYNDSLGYTYTPLKNDKVEIKYKQLDDFTFIHHGYINNVLEYTLTILKHILSEHKVLHINDIIEIFQENNYILELNTKLINKSYIIYILNKMILYNNIKSKYINNEYCMNNDEILYRVDDYIIVANDHKSIFNDLFNNKQVKERSLNMLNYVKNMDTYIIDVYRKIEKDIKELKDFFNVFNKNIPTSILKKCLYSSNNVIIKKVLKIKESKKKYTNEVIGLIDDTQHFKIKNSVFDKGISCTSIRKKQFYIYLENILKMSQSEIMALTIKELCSLVSLTLLQLELSDVDTIYFKLLI